MGALSTLPNIGPALERQLEDIGVTTPEQLAAMGSHEAWLRILARDPSACTQRLQGLEGAIRGIRKRELPEQVKQELRDFVREHKK